MRDRRPAVFLALSVLLPAAAVWAQQPARPAPPVRPADPVAAEHWRKRVEAVSALHRAMGVPDQAGLQCCNILQIPASAFTPVNSVVQYQRLIDVAPQSTGYVWVSTLGLEFFQFAAPVNLPSGTEIVYFDLYYYDETPGQISAYLKVYYRGGPFSGPPGFYPISIVNSGSGPTGYGVAESTAFSYTVNNDAEFQAVGGQLGVEISFLTYSPAAAFKGVDVWYAQQVSSAPATASFNDVPTSDPAFQFIEALKASGITVGCGGGNYCPDAPLTRRQMAVFLAKALGLYWSY